VPISANLKRDFSDFEFEVLEARRLAAEQRDALLRLFEANYERANPAFLDKSLAKLRRLAMAHREGVCVGFALAETRVIELPRISDQVVTLAGLCCIAPEFRRRGLFTRLELLAAAVDDVPNPTRRLMCGRMAHPAAFRTIGRLPGAVPAPGRPPTQWQQEVGTAIAEVFGVREFDPATFVCVGDGRPIGYPRIEFEVEAHEWEVFEAVDRDRGDALLALAWVPESPPGW
jgi:hypothetical protein